MVQLSRPYMTTRKTIALTVQTLVSKVISLLFNTLSRFVLAFLPRSLRCWLVCKHHWGCLALWLGAEFGQREAWWVEGQERRKSALSSSTTLFASELLLGQRINPPTTAALAGSPSSWSLSHTGSVNTAPSSCPIRFRDGNDFLSMLVPGGPSSSLMFSKQLCWSIMHIPYTSLTLSVQLFFCVCIHTSVSLSLCFLNLDHTLQQILFRFSSKCAFCFLVGHYLIVYVVVCWCQLISTHESWLLNFQEFCVLVTEHSHYFKINLQLVIIDKKY